MTRLSRDERLRVFFGSLAVFSVTSIYLINRLSLTGDEPWYMLQGYSLVHFRSVNMVRVFHDAQIYRQFIGSVTSARATDFRGNGVFVQVYLPGYAAIVGSFYALGGRWFVVFVQSLGGAVVATLLYQEMYRLWQARSAALFATVAYLTSLPALMYASQIFPSMLASIAAFVAYIAVVRALPVVRGWQSIATGGLIGALAAALPWLHAKYIPLALAIMAGALLQLALVYRADRVRAYHRRAERAAMAALTFSAPAVIPIASGPSRVNGDRRGSAWATLWAPAALITGLPLASLLSIILYSLQYFGVWYPQYRGPSTTTFVSPDVIHMVGLYRSMFLSGQGALILWVPLMLLVPVGLVALIRHSPREGWLTAVWIVGTLSPFLSSAIAPHVNQAFALPARFTVECQPFFVLCVASLFAVTWPRLRSGAQALSMGKGMLARWLPGVAALLALSCLLLVGVDTWFTFVGLLDPAALYPTSNGGVRLLLEYPHLLPGWWFALFGLHTP